MSIVVLIGLLVLPGCAAQRHGQIAPWVAAVAVAVSALSYWVYAVDKRRAEEGLWRVPEVRLHLLDFLGGWPGGFLAQRRLRHKCSKGSYQFTFWLIVLAWQFAAYDSLQSWRYSQTGLKWIEQTAKARR